MKDPLLAPAAALLVLAAACSSPPSGWREAERDWRERAPAGVVGAGEEGPRGAPEGAAAPGSGVPAHDGPAFPTPDASLGDYVRVALERSPAVQAAAQHWKAALERVPQVSALPDPRLTFAYFVDEIETRTGPMDWRVGLQQPFPWFGKLDLAGQAALARARAAAARFEAARLAVVRELRDAWFEQSWLAAAIEVTAGHRDLLLSWEEVARVRYETGIGRDDDVIRAQVEVGKLDDRLRSLEDLRRPVAARINAVVDLPAATPVPPPAGPAPRVEPLDERALAEELADTAPALAALALEIDAAETSVALADKEGWPDFSLGLEYTAIGSARASGVDDSGKDALAVTAGLSLPLRRQRIRAAQEGARAELGAARASHAAERNRLAAELEMALYHVRDAERRLGLYRDTLVPKGQEAVSSTTTSYQAGEASFLDLIDAERALLEFQLAVARAETDRLQALAEVESLSGVPLFLEDQP